VYDSYSLIAVPFDDGAEIQSLYEVDLVP